MSELQFTAYGTFKSREIQLYHYHHHLTSIYSLLVFLTAFDDYIESRTNEDPVHDNFVPDGDEIPEGCFELALLEDVLEEGGDAIGFRNVFGKNTVEWMCFGLPMKGCLEAFTGKGERQIFDLVGVVETNTQEHRQWYDSLLTAETKE